MTDKPGMYDQSWIASLVAACNHAGGMYGINMKIPRLLFALPLLCAASQASAVGISEQDYFTDLPEVLTVTRLAQPLSETPGAVTVINRETIRRSGARDITDLMRLVPGYMVTGFNGANQAAAYHAPIDEYGTRNLILVDGRSVYSIHYLGSTHRGLAGVLLEDIDRIEVLRGSNSAAYGNNAMFGVINIITRHAADTVGTSFSITGGEGGINDTHARIGWGGPGASFRLSAGSRRDDGYPGVHDDRRLQQLHFRADLQSGTGSDLALQAGVSEIASGEGFANKPTTDPTRTADWRNVYIRGKWHRQLDATESIQLSASFDEETFGDQFLYTPPGVIIGSSGQGRRFDVEFQHQRVWSPKLRSVLGTGFKREEDVSPMVFFQTQEESMQEPRLFGNFEWRPHAQWLVNLGGYWGKPSRRSSYFSPRAMVNFLMTPNHTLRAGTSKAVRVPTLLELYGHVRFAGFDLVKGTPDLQNEQLDTREIGYFGRSDRGQLTLDVRGFEETMTHLVGKRGSNPERFIDKGDFRTRGYEYELRWKPIDGTEFILSQSFMQLDWLRGVTTKNNQPPARKVSLAWFQKLPYELDFGLMYAGRTPMTWGGAGATLPASERIDVRLALPFRIGSTRAEVAAVVQQANGSQSEYLFEKSYVSERRAFATLRLEF